MTNDTPTAEPDEETADDILQHVPEVIKRAKQMRSLAEKTKFFGETDNRSR